MRSLAPIALCCLLATTGAPGPTRRRWRLCVFGFVGGMGGAPCAAEWAEACVAEWDFRWHARRNGRWHCVFSVALEAGFAVASEAASTEDSDSAVTASSSTGDSDSVGGGQPGAGAIGWGGGYWPDYYGDYGYGDYGSVGYPAAGYSFSPSPNVTVIYPPALPAVSPGLRRAGGPSPSRIQYSVRPTGRSIPGIGGECRFSPLSHRPERSHHLRCRDVLGAGRHAPLRHAMERTEAGSAQLDRSRSQHAVESRTSRQLSVALNPVLRRCCSLPRLANNR